MTNFLLGLDGGGTQTRAVAATETGTVVGRGQGGPCNLAAVSLPDALGAAFAAADEALAEAGGHRREVVALCAGVAGASFEARRREFQAALQSAFPVAQIAAEPDYVIALSGATGGKPGLIVIAGTGSAAYGENAAGKSHKTGAYGYLIDDAGSGYGVGRAALAAVLRAADGTGPATILTERLLSALKRKTTAEIVPAVYGGELGRLQIAALSRAVAEAARENDAVAVALLMRAGGSLAHLAQGVTQRLFAEANTPCPVVPIGGLWKAGEALSEVFVRSLRRFAPQTVFMPPERTPAEGAILRAQRML